APRRERRGARLAVEAGDVVAAQPTVASLSTRTSASSHRACGIAGCFPRPTKTETPSPARAHPDLNVSSEQLLVESEQMCLLAGPGVVLRDGTASALTHLPGLLGIVEQPGDGRGQGSRVGPRNADSATESPDDAVPRRNVRGDHGQP